jgi:hypothetical protein
MHFTADMFDDWTGGCYLPGLKWFLVWGGGHIGWGGNEILAFDLNPDSTTFLTWFWISEPSTLDAIWWSYWQHCAPTDPMTGQPKTAFPDFEYNQDPVTLVLDGKPNVQHTNQMLAADWRMNWLFAAPPTGVWGSGQQGTFLGQNACCRAYHFGQRRWDTPYNLPKNYDTAYTCTATDSRNGNIWILSNQRASGYVAEYSAGSNTLDLRWPNMTTYGSFGGIYSCATFAKGSNRIIKFGYNHYECWDVTDHANIVKVAAYPQQLSLPVPTGDLTPLAYIGPPVVPTIDYCDSTDMAYIWGGQGVVYQVNPNTHRIDLITASTPTPPAFPSGFTGLFNRWRYIPHLDIFMGAWTKNSPVWFWRPSLP